MKKNMVHILQKTLTKWTMNLKKCRWYTLYIKSESLGKFNRIFVTKKIFFILKNLNKYLKEKKIICLKKYT